MRAKVHSAAVLGIGAYPVEVETNAGWEQPQVIIVGLPDAAVKVSRDRVKAAIEKIDFKPASRRLVANLASARIMQASPAINNLGHDKPEWNWHPAGDTVQLRKVVLK